MTQMHQTARAAETVLQCLCLRECPLSAADVGGIPSRRKAFTCLVLTTFRGFMRRWFFLRNPGEAISPRHHYVSEQVGGCLGEMISPFLLNLHTIYDVLPDGATSPGPIHPTIETVGFLALATPTDFRKGCVASHPDFTASKLLIIKNLNHSSKIMRKICFVAQFE